MSDTTLWDIKLISFKYISVWWRRIYSLSLTPFSETYELRGYVVEGYQRYIPNFVMWHAECCCVMIIGWSFGYDHLFDHLSLWLLLWSSVDPKHGFVTQSVALWTRLRQDLTPRKWSKQEYAARLWGSRPLGYVISFWKRVVSWYGAQIFTHVDTLYYYVWCWLPRSRIEVPKDREVAYSWVTCYRSNPALLAESSLSLGTSRQRRSHAAERKFLSLTICWKSKEIIRTLYGF